MLVIGIIVVILVLILILPVGADAAYADNMFSLSIKAGPFRIGILPSKHKDGDKKAKKPAKAKKTKKTKKDENSGSDAQDKGAKKPKMKLRFDDIMGIVRIGLSALGRFRRSISIDLLKLHLVTAGPDPYSAVMSYGYINAAVGAALPLLHKAFKVKKEDYASDVDFESDKLKIDLRAVLSVRIWEILLIVLCAAFGFVKWMLRRKRRLKAEAKAKAQAQADKTKKTEESSAEKGN